MRKRFQVPELTLPEGFAASRLAGRLDLLGHLDRQRADLDRVGRPRDGSTLSGRRPSRC